MLQRAFFNAIIHAMSCIKRLNAKSLNRHPSADVVKRILATALDAANPADAVRRELTRTQNLLQVNGQDYPLSDFSAVYLVLVGKAAMSMAEATTDILGNDLTEGIVVSKKDPEKRQNPLAAHPSVLYLEASHPIPDNQSLFAGRKIFELLTKTTADDLLIFLISGGGSALMTVPVDGVSLDDLAKPTFLLFGCGARVNEINILRRALDRIKGGGLADAAALT
ncbi:MAG: glycerate-2-kinase family protein [Anaerolineae bacterium]|nr:glycerate-2-kinase family protein [Anaerolineae bacterium]MBT7325337.1 glycerate-2-kinase family protein [Anaerolineae bacterium]